jgi:hypothetical protein
VPVEAPPPPSALENLPAGHSMQTEALAAEYVPAAQLAQAEASMAPTASEYLPAVQSVQTEAPATAEYVPTLHLMQVSASEAPTLVEIEPALHLVHCTLPVTHQSAVKPSASLSCPDSKYTMSLSLDV